MAKFVDGSVREEIERRGRSGQCKEKKVSVTELANVNDGPRESGMCEAKERQKLNGQRWFAR